MIAIVGRVRRVAFASEKEMDEAIALLIETVTPRIVTLLKEATNQTSDEEIVDAALSTKPILL